MKLKEGIKVQILSSYAGRFPDYIGKKGIIEKVLSKAYMVKMKDKRLLVVNLDNVIQCY